VRAEGLKIEWGKAGRVRGERREAKTNVERVENWKWQMANGRGRTELQISYFGFQRKEGERRRRAASKWRGGAESDATGLPTTTRIPIGEPWYLSARLLGGKWGDHPISDKVILAGR